MQLPLRMTFIDLFLCCDEQFLFVVFDSSNLAGLVVHEIFCFTTAAFDLLRKPCAKAGNVGDPRLR